jgi:UDP-N-acetylmuramate dehydrogenase
MTLSQFAYKNDFEGHEFLFGIPGNCGGAAFMNAGAYEHCISEIISHVTYYDVSEHMIVHASVDELEYAYRESAFRKTGNIVLSIEVKLEKSNDVDAVRSLMEDHLRTRNQKQPLEYPSAGSTFKRPEGYFAGALIQECELKGKSVGGAQVSEKHAGFVINKDNATSTDILNLIDLIKNTVKAETGVTLEPEVIVLR